MLKHNVRDIIFSSTCSTYGIPNVIPIQESHAQNPINPYGRSKLVVEEIIKDYHKSYNFNYSILRYFNAAGADLNCDIGESHSPETHLIPLVIKAALDSGVITREQFDLLAVAINTGTNIPSIATPNGQAAFLFLLTSSLAPLINLSYMRMVLMALPYTIVLSIVGFLSIIYLL